MMISLRTMSYEELKNALSKDDKIILWSCNTCIKFCGLGGFDRMKQLEGMLNSDGYNVIGKELISIACMYNLAEQHRADEKKKAMFDEATAIITLACEDGNEVVKKVFEDKKVIGFTKTIGVGNFSMARGPVLTHPFEYTGLKQNENGYDYGELAAKCNLYPTFFDSEYEAKEDKTEYVNIKVNGKDCKAKKDQVLLKACEENGFKIPHLCYEEDLSSVGACRLCVLKVKGARGLVPACCTKVTEGMEITTEDDELNHYRQIILELLLAGSDHNCLYCSKGNPCIAGSCELEGLIRKFGIEKSRFEDSKNPMEVDDSSPILSYDPNKCVLCGRCVRACEEIAGQNNLGFVNRGARTVVAAGTNKLLNQSACITCMACVFACPTGAMTEKIEHYVGEDWRPIKVRQS